MSENIISWNFPNWLTITLMAAIGLAVVAMLAQLFHYSRASSASTGLGGN